MLEEAAGIYRIEKRQERGGRHALVAEAGGSVSRGYRRAGRRGVMRSLAFLFIYALEAGLIFK